MTELPDLPDLSGAARTLAAAAGEAGRIIAELAKAIGQVFQEVANDRLIMLWRKQVPGKWMHFYLHSRKYRVRKKWACGINCGLGKKQPEERN